MIQKGLNLSIEQLFNPYLLEIYQMWSQYEYDTNYINSYSVKDLHNSRFHKPSSNLIK